MERIIVVPLRKARRGPRTKYAQKAVKYLRSFVCRHMKVSEVKIGPELNELIWEKGRKNPPRKVEIRALKQDSTALVELSSVSETDWKEFINRKEKEDKKAKKADKKDKKEETNKAKEKPAKKKTEKKPAKKPSEKKPAKKAKPAEKKKPAVKKAKPAAKPKNKEAKKK